LAKRDDDAESLVAGRTGVYQALLDRFVSHEIAPGSRITIDAVSRDLGVSQTPVRQALGVLEADGLVVRTHLSGYRALPELTEDDLDDLFALRLLLEPYAAEEAARRRTDVQLKAMWAACDEMAQSIDRSAAVDGGATVLPRAYGKFNKQDAELHDQVAVAAGNEYVRTSLRRLHVHIRLMCLQSDVAVAPESVGEHQNFIQAIADRDAVVAAAMMHSHIEKSRERFRLAIKSRHEDLMDREFPT
jgi:DNA-binding GntR family transcriptional regulator